MDEELQIEFRAYFAARLPELLRLAYLLTGDPAEAEDLAQTALARTLVAWRRVRESDSPDAYVRRILVNAHRRRFRRRVPESPMATVPEQEARSSAAELAAVEDRAGLARALAVLPARQRAVVVLRYCEDLPEARVAEILGCSTGTVKTHASRGLARLRADPSLAAAAASWVPAASGASGAAAGSAVSNGGGWAEARPADGGGADRAQPSSSLEVGLPDEVRGGAA
ncbi:SigE family RNA polymerase sigma factor [Parafrankia sp. EUN1f]|uniref:SigE family RNA polymerase sigma factor n=1 Tax=Parafrankia sp. EUN1f TaxID=102897 RepID=UPI0001C46894|nr:SigE family RNA polymerase sigma factor [Parafrankia sp. EUN1f]EFC80595.1 transcriptional regulator, LuxR family [Parafrankia sp. EUN1f]